MWPFVGKPRQKKSTSSILRISLSGRSFHLLVFIFQPSKSNLLELMLTSEFNPDADEIDVGDVDQRDNVVKRRLLTNEELVAQCLLFLLAGYETTSTTLAYIMYEMSVNPEAQKRLQEEIDELFPENVSYCDFLLVLIITFLSRPLDEVIIIIKACKYTCI